ncbi:hypothetical protein N8940_00375 [Sphingomonadaceae bacterium]|nr:hypothetical protein [Sphingomonadaceae bacterium]
MASKLGKTGAKPPISAHRAFPAIVALWFAALFGLGSLVLPVALIEGLVNAAGISSVISAAEPPLGATTRIIIALLAAGIGVVLGLFLARKVKASNAPEPVRQRAATLDQAAKQAADQTAEGSVPEAKRPISAHEELGSEFLDDPVDADDADDFDNTDIDADSGFQRPPPPPCAGDER